MLLGTRQAATVCRLKGVVACMNVELNYQPPTRKPPLRLLKRGIDMTRRCCHVQPP